MRTGSSTIRKIMKKGVIVGFTTRLVTIENEENITENVSSNEVVKIDW